jgi:hypothetical protein
MRLGDRNNHRKRGRKRGAALGGRSTPRGESIGDALKSTPEIGKSGQVATNHKHRGDGGAGEGDEGGGFILFSHTLAEAATVTRTLTTRVTVVGRKRAIKAQALGLQLKEKLAKKRIY